MTIQIGIREYFSIPLIRGAAQFAREADRVEAAYEGGFEETIIHSHQANVLSSIMLSTAAVEAFINEMFSDAAEDTGAAATHLTAESKLLMREMWEKGVPRRAGYPILQKYEIALALLRKPPMDTAVEPYQSVKLLVELRNAVVHYEPSWQISGKPSDRKETAHEKLVRKLKDKFPDNRMARQMLPFFPLRLLGHGCAAWSVASSVNFMNKYMVATGGTARFDLTSPQLATSVA